MDAEPVSEVSVQSGRRYNGLVVRRVGDKEDERVPEWAEDDQENLPPGGAIVSAPPRHPAAPPSSRAGKELVLALVQHATGILQGAMAPFLEAHCHMFEQDAEELRSGAGETHEQYAAFMAFVAELVRARGSTQPSASNLGSTPTAQLPPAMTVLRFR